MLSVIKLSVVAPWKGLPEAKHSSLSRTLENYGRKSFKTLAPAWKEELLKIQKSFCFNFQKNEKNVIRSKDFDKMLWLQFQAFLLHMLRKYNHIFRLHDIRQNDIKQNDSRHYRVSYV